MSSRGLSISGLGKSKSSTLVAWVYEEEIIGLFDLSVSHQCYESDRTYAQRGFTPPSLPLPYTRGSLFLNWHAVSSPCSDLFVLPRHGALLLSPSWKKRAATCGHVHSSRTLIPLTAYRCGLARIMRGGACMHGSRRT
ncbi:hypothetical protein V8C26DRAFT_159491 [Trichoderma gracile]